MGFLTTFTYSPFGELETTTTPSALSDATTQTETFTRIYDKNGRLTEERDPYFSATPTGHFVRYEYDPVGRTLRSSGTAASDNTYRFSTKRL